MKSDLLLGYAAHFYGCNMAHMKIIIIYNNHDEKSNPIARAILEI